MFRKVEDFFRGWYGLIGIYGFVVALVIAVIGGAYYAESHRTADLGSGLELKVVGKCYHHRESGERNKFSASNELDYSDMSMEPIFRLKNNGPEPRAVKVHSLSAHKVPVTGTVCLEPGQQFEFQIHGQHKHWYCWITPVPIKVVRH